MVWIHERLYKEWPGITLPVRHYGKAASDWDIHKVFLLEGHVCQPSNKSIFTANSISFHSLSSI